MRFNLPGRVQKRNEDCVQQSDMITNIKPTKLMDYFNSMRKRASPRKYEEYKVTIAAHIKNLKDMGKILGLKHYLFVAIQ